MGLIASRMISPLLGYTGGAAKERFLAFWCPGCGCIHQIRVSGDKHPVWGWNDSAHAPTFTPSILVRSSRAKDERICHSFVTDGKIIYLDDCTHEMAGQTIDLPAMPTEWVKFFDRDPVEETVEV